jgi:hypothetical protein
MCSENLSLVEVKLVLDMLKAAELERQKETSETKLKETAAESSNR